MTTQEQTEDKYIKCVDCGDEFMFSQGEQKFFNSKTPPLQTPKRCHACRARRKAQIARPEDMGGGL